MQKLPRPPQLNPLPWWWKPLLKSPQWIKPKHRTRPTRLPRPPAWRAPMPLPCPKVLRHPPCRNAPPSPALANLPTARKKAQRPAALPVARPLPRRRFVLFPALCPALPPHRKPAPPVRVMAAPAVIPPVTALVAPVVIPPVTVLADPVVIRRVPVDSVLVAPAAPVAPAVRRVLLAAPVLVAPLAALDSRVRLPRPLIPATDRAKKSALRVAVQLTSSRVILVAVPTMTTVVV